MKRFSVTALIAALACTWLTPLALAQTANYPSKPLSLLVPVPPGGILDGVARVVAPSLGQKLGQQIIVINKPGAGGNIATDFVARSEPDGYTFLLGYSMFHVGSPSMYENISWDPVRDFHAVGMVAVSPHVLAVHPSLPVKTLRELVDYAKVNPGKLNYATSGNGSVPHVGMELFKQQNQLKIEHIPYKGAGPAVQDVVAGNAQIIVMTPPSLLGFIQGQKLRPIAVAAKERMAQLPDVPTSGEAGFPGFELEAWVGIFAPAKTPTALITKVTTAVKEVLELSQVKKSFDIAGVAPRYMAPSELDSLVKHDVDYWGGVIRKADIRVD